MPADGSRRTSSYEDQIWFTGSPEEAFDFVCDIHVGPIAP
jgi:hypothetical protein